MFIYFLLPHWVRHIAKSGADQHQSRVQEIAHHAGVAADLPAQPLKAIVGADASPVFIRKITSRSESPQCHLPPSWPVPSVSWNAQFLHHGFGLLSGGPLALLSVDCLKHLVTSFTLDRDVTENTLR